MQAVVAPPLAAAALGAQAMPGVSLAQALGGFAGVPLGALLGQALGNFGGFAGQGFGGQGFGGQPVPPQQGIGAQNGFGLPQAAPPTAAPPTAAPPWAGVSVPQVLQQLRQLGLI
jgi:hypothetical protein